VCGLVDYGLFEFGVLTCVLNLISIWSLLKGEINVARKC
jgi:hypothetical protein